MKKVVLGTDDAGPVLDAVIARLEELGIDLTVLQRAGWQQVARQVGEGVGSGRFDEGVLMCWTGTGTSMMANKVPGVRAALCWEPWIAQGARKYNDANVLVMSLKRTSPETASQILDAWFADYQVDPQEAPAIQAMNDYEAGRVRGLD